MTVRRESGHTPLRAADDRYTLRTGHWYLKERATVSNRLLSRGTNTRFRPKAELRATQMDGATQTDVRAPIRQWDCAAR